MAIRFTCQCGKVVVTGDEYAGRRGKCPQCGAVIRIPQPDNVEPAIPVAEIAMDAYRSPVAPPLPQANPMPPANASTGALVSCQPKKDGGTLCFQGVTPDGLGSQIATFFTREGYRHEAGALTGATYGKGSNVMRFLLGAFAKRFKFRVDVVAQDQFVWVKVSKAMSGMMGGVIGYSSMKKETGRIVQAMRQYFS